MMLPSRNGLHRYALEERKITFDVPVEAAPGVINNSRDHFEFTFNQTFDTGTKQDAIFDAVARPIIDGALDGFNGTIFAYGQTGSGKTFTMTGGQSSFNDRGIIPRTLQYLFQTFKKRTDCSHQVHISYMEIYNEHGCDAATCWLQQLFALLNHFVVVTRCTDTICWQMISKAATM